MSKFKVLTVGVVSAMVFLLAGCSNDTTEQNQDNVFKGYEKALDKAKQLQPQMEEAEEKRRKQMEEMLK